MSFMKLVFERLIPPADATPEVLAAWRMAVFLVMIAIAGALIAHIVVINGWLGTQPPFARYDDLETMRLEMRDQTRRTLEIDVLNLRVRQCEALKNDNQDAARFAGETLQERRLEYQRITAHGYPLPTCREVGVDTR